MTIVFVHNHRAFLPELEAYTRFFSPFGVECHIAGPDEVGLMHRQVEWRLMGTDFTKPREGIIRIHEYSSSSVPPNRKWKNWMKSFFNAQPDFRLFLNPYVKQEIGIHDRIPYGYRDMGVPAGWLSPGLSGPEPEFDFVYAGDLSPYRAPERMLDHFAEGALKDRSLLVISAEFARLAARYGGSGNIHFTGPVAHADMPAALRRARFGLNYMVDREPASRQTSTKMLEYLACGLKVVSTDYAWARRFAMEQKAGICFVKPDLDDFTWEKVNQCQYSAPDMNAFTWETRIRESGVLEFLKERIGGLAF